MAGYFLESYIVFSYTQKVEMELFRKIIPSIINKYNQIHESVCNYRYSEPYLRKDKNVQGSLKLKCVNDAEYFNVHHIRIELKKGANKVHQEFWKELRSMLSALEL